MAVQPQPMPVVTIQPCMFRSPAVSKTEVWSSSICDCCDDMKICCIGFWCPCCLCCIPSTSVALRSNMRERYHIQGTICNDCLMVTCCPTVPGARCGELKLRQLPLLPVNVPSSVQINIHPPHPLFHSSHPSHPLSHPLSHPSLPLSHPSHPLSHPSYPSQPYHPLSHPSYPSQPSHPLSHPSHPSHHLSLPFYPSTALPSAILECESGITASQQCITKISVLNPHRKADTFREIITFTGNHNTI